MNNLRKYNFQAKQHDVVEKLVKLEPRVRHCLSGYDYCPENKEAAIIAEKYEKLKVARETYDEANKQLEILMESIKQAQQLSETADNHIKEMGLEPLAEKDDAVEKFCSKYFDNVEENKENLY